MSSPMTFGKSASLSRNYATKSPLVSPLVTTGRPKFTPKTAPLQRSPPLSNTPIPRPTQLTIPTTSRSNQPFCHSTLSGKTDQQTDRHAPLALTLA